MAILEKQQVTLAVLPLVHGERLNQSAFHERYDAMPPGTRAELIGGKVYLMPSPVSREHWKPHSTVMWWLLLYGVETPAVEVMDNPTIFMGLSSEPQPDAGIRILPEHGGRTTIRRVKRKTYVEGAPELLVEISASTIRLDINQKKQDYEQAGVDEYVVILPETQEIEWFYLENGSYRSLQAGPDGIFRSTKFPGLWLELAALIDDDKKRVREVIQQGLASLERPTD